MYVDKKYRSRWHKTVKSYSLSELLSHIAFPFHSARQELDIRGGFRNRYSMAFLTQNLFFLKRRCSGYELRHTNKIGETGADKILIPF
jgi:hypothetical protein